MNRQGLVRTLTTRDAFMLVTGNIIGIGIFTTTGHISQYVSSPGMMMGIWVIGGILAFCGGLTYAELATRFPRAGGDFHYLSHAYHPLLGFFFGWSTFVVTYTGSLAVIAVGFSHYFFNLFPPAFQDLHFVLPLIGFEIGGIKIAAILITALFTFLNTRGIKSGVRWQLVLTLVTVAILLTFIAVGLTSPSGDWGHFSPLFAGKTGESGLFRLGAALIGIFFTYSGWTALVYIAGEVKTPRKTIPTGISLGVLVVVLLYLAMNVVYLYALPLSGMRNVVDIGYRVLLNLRGKEWSLFFNIMILIAVLSTLNVTVLSGARIYYAMSQKSQFFAPAGRLHPRYRSPANSLWLQFGWTVLLILSGSFNQLLTYTVFIMVCFAFLTGLSLFILRRRQGMPPDVYAAWGYPFTTLLYVLITGWIMLNTLWENPLQSLLGITVILLGLPFYYYFRRRNSG